MASLVETAPAKINLTLRVAGRRADGFHELESLVAFADFADRLSLEPGANTSLEIDGPFAEACGDPADNLVLRAAGVLGMPAGRFSLDKRIPVAAGLGGGSADAAAALRLMARANAVAVDDPRITAVARAAGADVPVCLDGRARIMRGTGGELSPPVALPKLPAVLVNPGVPLSTAEVFAGFAPRDCSATVIADVPRAHDALIAWLADRGNDLTRAATVLVPEIADVLAALRALTGCRLARMSGSGASCFALFDDASAAGDAAGRLAKARQNWWICSTTLS